MDALFACYVKETTELSLLFWKNPGNLFNNNGPRSTIRVWARSVYMVSLQPVIMEE